MSVSVQKSGDRQRERRNRCVKIRAIVGLHEIFALHGADRGFQHGAAGVAKLFAGVEMRLLSDDAVAGNLLVGSD